MYQKPKHDLRQRRENGFSMNKYRAALYFPEPKCGPSVRRRLLFKEFDAVAPPSPTTSCPQSGFNQREI